ncbi:MAG TPA: glycosyltransferase [Acidimicrobiales bacterium]|nr:glycosyltransferase [Acidimicrobiales bacterium]
MADTATPRAPDETHAPDERGPGGQSHAPDEVGVAADPRTERPVWPGLAQWRQVDRKLTVLFPVSLLAAMWYFEWLLRPERIGNRALYGLLIVAELFNLVQAAGFWWTCRHGRDRPAVRAATVPGDDVDILIPVCNEPLEVVRPTVAAALAVRGSTTVYLLDDAGRPELAALAAHLGARYLRRGDNRGAKAGNLNDALAHCRAPFVAVFDCDHVPDSRFLEATMEWFADPATAFVQTPQYYANARRGGVAAAAWAQQALFFGGIARGKDGLGAMFCCGTNVVFRRRALDDVGGFPEGSLTEDFELSVHLHELGWRSAYVNEVLAQGLGPEDMASYVSQQQRWARGCLAAVPAAVRAELPVRIRMQYLLSSMFFLSGWTFALYMAFPVVRILTGAQPLAGTTADQFLLHFAPYFCLSLGAVAVAGAGRYTFEAFALLIANFWVHVVSTLFVVAGRRGRFVVTAKRGRAGPQPLAVVPALLVMGALGAAMGFALTRRPTAGTVNNMAFAVLHLAVLTVGVWPALTGRSAAVSEAASGDGDTEARAA